MLGEGKDGKNIYLAVLKGNKQIFDDGGDDMSYLVIREKKRKNILHRIFCS